MPTNFPPDPQALRRFSSPRNPGIALLISGHFLLALLSTWLISKISFIGKVGIATVHKEYQFLRSGWRTFFLLFGVQLIVILLLAVTARKFSRMVFRIVGVTLLLIAILGLFVTFEDFLHTYTHRLLKERFHLGFYLFWFGWIGTCIYFLVPAGRRGDKLFPSDPHAPTVKDEA